MDAFAEDLMKKINAVTPEQWRVAGKYCHAMSNCFRVGAKKGARRLRRLRYWNRVCSRWEAKIKPGMG